MADETPVVGQVITDIDRAIDLAQKIADAPAVVLLVFGFIGMTWLWIKQCKITRKQAKRIGYLREEYIIVSMEAKVDSDILKARLKKFDED